MSQHKTVTFNSKSNPPISIENQLRNLLRQAREKNEKLLIDFRKIQKRNVEVVTELKKVVKDNERLRMENDKLKKTYSYISLEHDYGQCK